MVEPGEPCPFDHEAIDEHGFHILGRLRAYYPETRSVMMDLETLRTFQSLYGKGNGKGENVGNAPKNLLASEEETFAEIQRSNSRLEQEKIPLDYSCKKILEAFPAI